MCDVIIGIKLKGSFPCNQVVETSNPVPAIPNNKLLYHRQNILRVVLQYLMELIRNCTNYREILFFWSTIWYSNKCTYNNNFWIHFILFLLQHYSITLTVLQSVSVHIKEGLARHSCYPLVPLSMNKSALSSHVTQFDNCHQFQLENTKLSLWLFSEQILL